MKRSISLFLFAVYTVSSIFAQDKFEYDLKPDELLSKEVVLKGTQARDVKLMLGVKWLETDKRIQLVFDRKKIRESGDYLLLFPSFVKKMPINDIVDCGFRKRLLWTESNSGQLQYMDYFLTSDNLKISDFKNCAISLAKNNEEEFNFAMIDAEKEEFTITLNGLFVAQTSKKPWYTFSPRDKKLEFKVNPVTLVIRPEKKVEVVDFCAITEEMAPRIKSVQEIMKKDYADMMEAQKNRNCTLFAQLQEKIRRTFIETKEKYDEYIECEKIAAAINECKGISENALKEECRVAAPVTATCNLSENELTNINTRLRNLQMSINVKKRDGASTAEENKEFQQIKASVNPRISAECRRRHQSLIDAYTNYCRIIESLL